MKSIWLKRTPKFRINKDDLIIEEIAEIREKDDSIIEEIAKIREIENVQEFLNPSKGNLFHPSLMKNIDVASKRIIQALQNNERICLSYDSDADGITATTIMYKYLKKYTDNVYYIYGERNNGHGIEKMITLDVNDDEQKQRNEENLQRIKESDLIILIDSSSNDVEACRYIKQELGKDIIILDHHVIEKENPYVIMVNPQQKDCQYPNKHLSGAGVVFKVIQLMEEILQNFDVFDYIDLVAVGMYGDVMRVDVLENRYLIIQGMKNIKNNGFLQILKDNKVNLKSVNSNTLGFTIVPLLNGVARMDNVKLAIDFLLEDDESKVKEIYRQIKELNNSRKRKQNMILSDYESYIVENNKIMIVVGDNFDKGFNGVIAQKLASEYKKPVIVGKLHKGWISGSCRSYGGFKMKSFLNELDYVEAIGHEEAFGVSLHESKLNDLITYVNENMESFVSKNIIYFDLEFKAKDVRRYLEPIQQFNYLCGNGFPKITVKVNDLMVEERTIIGKNNDICKIKTIDGIDLIKFNVNEEYANELGFFNIINVVGELQLNEWYNFALRKKISTLQVIMEDYKHI